MHRDQKLHQTVKTTIIYVTHDQVEAMTSPTASSSCATGGSNRSDRRSRSETPVIACRRGFIGSPAMNMIGQRSGQTASGPMASWPDGPCLPVRCRVCPHLTDGQEVILGVRPEHLKVLDGFFALPPEWQTSDGVSGRPLGSETLVPARFGDHELTGKGDGVAFRARDGCASASTSRISTSSTGRRSARCRTAPAAPRGCARHGRRRLGAFIGRCRMARLDDRYDFVAGALARPGGRARAARCAASRPRSHL
jgi:ABC-type sugar transport system ATPase subunit